MAADDRDQSFEKALEGHLRADATASGSSAHGACADAETLAAYHEGLLAPDQVASTKQHLHACARCQEILAHLQATDEIPLAAAEAGAQQLIPAASAAKPAVHVFKPRSASLWRWVAPAGALAAVLLGWVAVRENTPVRMPAQAEVASKSVPATSAPSSPPSSGDAAGVARAAGAGGPDGTRTYAPSPHNNLADQRRSALSKEKDSMTALQSAPSFTSREQLPDDSLHRYAPAAPRSDLSPKAENDRIRVLPARPLEQKQLDEKADSLYTAAAAPQPAPPTGAVAGALSSPTAESSAARSKAFAKKVAAPPPPAATRQEQQIGGMSRCNENAEVRLANSISDVTISAPGGAVAWRVGSAGIIENSSDAGKNWTPQPSGVSTDLLAGSAPSDKICWIVGRAGTILRTTDGGAHWQKIRSPVQEDIRSIIAENARQATISVTNGAYETLDAGATWNKLATE